MKFEQEFHNSDNDSEDIVISASASHFGFRSLQLGSIPKNFIQSLRVTSRSFS